MKYYSNEIMHFVIYNNRIKISMIIIIAHAVILPAYAITAPLSPRGVIDHCDRAATVCGGSQPASQRLNLQIYDGILLRLNFCGIRRNRSRWYSSW